MYSVTFTEATISIMSHHCCYICDEDQISLRSLLRNAAACVLLHSSYIFLKKSVKSVKRKDDSLN